MAGASMVLAMLAVTACGKPDRVRSRPVTHVACIGDSITQGAGASSPELAYPIQLAALFRASGREVVVGNFGVGGRTMLRTGNFPYWTSPTLAPAKAFVTGAGPAAVVDVIIMLGTNDSKNPGHAPGGANNWSAGAADRYRAAYRDMIDELLALTPRPVVYLALPPPVYTTDYDLSDAVIRDEQVPIIRALAAERGLPVIDVYAGMSNVAGEFMDGVHPNDAGYAHLTRVILHGLDRVPAPVVTLAATTATVTLPDDPVQLARVSFMLDGGALAEATSPPFTASLANLAPGEHTLSATVVDTTGASATTQSVRVTR